MTSSRRFASALIRPLALAAAVSLTPMVPAPRALAADAQAQTELPATAPGKAARALLDALNSGDRAAMDRFVAATVPPDAPPGAADGARDHMRKLYAQSGGFDVVGVRPSEEPNVVRAIIRARRGGHKAFMFIAVSKADPTKIEGMGVRPADAEPAPWPEGKVAEADLPAAIDRHVSQYAAADHFSGAVLVAKGDRVLFSKAYGQAEKVYGAPNTVDTKFNLGSMNKMFTSVAIAQLVEAGKLSYEDTLAKVLPEYPNKETAAKITIHHILTHTSGLGDIFKPEFFKEREKFVKPSDYFPLFASEPLKFEPGKGWSYSNGAFVVAGAIVEKVSGQSYYDYIREHVYKPAGMNDSDSYPVDQVVPNLAYGYTRFGGDDELGIEPRRSNIPTMPRQGSPAGGGYSTVGDLFKFARALRSGKLVSPATAERITAGKVDSPFGAKYAYGFMDFDMGGRSVRGHGGGAPGINSDLKIFWDGSWTVAVMGNYDPPAAQNLSQEIAEFLSKQ